MQISRRDALHAGVACGAVAAGRLLAPAPAKANLLGANDRISVGVIGTGVRGKYLIGNLPASAEVISICDCSDSRMADTLKPQGKFAAILDKFSNKAARGCTTHQDYHRMLDREKLDAVIIATPDHHHAQAALLALDAGLDVYLEKPLTITIREGRRLADKVKKTGRVLQVGSQQRTMEINRFACEFIRDGGLGKIAKVEVPNYPGPLSNLRFDAEPTPKGLDWNLFLGPTPLRPHNRKLWVKDEFKVGRLVWRGWDLFREYSGHLMTNWGAHSIDMVQYALGMDHSGPVKIIPVSDIPAPALEQDWKDKWHKKTPRAGGAWADADRFRPVVLEYANGVSLRLTPGVDAATFHGEHGQMVIGRNSYKINPPDLIREKPDPKIAAKWVGGGHVARPHLQNWLDCIRSRRVPNAPVEIGHRSVTVCHLVNIARELKRPLRWDPAKEQFPGDAEANKLLTRPRRNGFKLPAV